MSGFAMAEPWVLKRSPELKVLQHKAMVIRMLQGLITNTRRSAAALEGKLTPEEHEQVSRAAERGNSALEDGDLQLREDCLKELEAAAAVIGAAMLRD